MLTKKVAKFLKGKFPKKQILVHAIHETKENFVVEFSHDFNDRIKTAKIHRDQLES